MSLPNLCLPTSVIKKRRPKFWPKKRSVTITISDVDPQCRVVYLGNVVTGWAKGAGCVEKPLSILWRNHCAQILSQNDSNSPKPKIMMKLTVSASGLKAVTKEHGLTEYWANKITHCSTDPSYPKLFCWIYRHEGRKFKQELRCHAVLCPSESKAQFMAEKLRERVSQALFDFRKEKVARQNARLSLANTIYENPTMPFRKILLQTGTSNYRQPVAERSKSVPRLKMIEEDDEDQQALVESLLFTDLNKQSNNPLDVDDVFVPCDEVFETSREPSTASNSPSCVIIDHLAAKVEKLTCDTNLDDEDEDISAPRERTGSQCLTPPMSKESPYVVRVVDRDDTKERGVDISSFKLSVEDSSSCHDVSSSSSPSLASSVTPSPEMRSSVSQLQQSSYRHLKPSSQQNHRANRTTHQLRRNERKSTNPISVSNTRSTAQKVYLETPLTYVGTGIDNSKIFDGRALPILSSTESSDSAHSASSPDSNEFYTFSSSSSETRRVNRGNRHGPPLLAIAAVAPSSAAPNNNKPCFVERNRVERCDSSSSNEDEDSIDNDDDANDDLLSDESGFSDDVMNSRRGKIPSSQSRRRPNMVSSTFQPYSLSSVRNSNFNTIQPIHSAMHARVVQKHNATNTENNDLTVKGVDMSEFTSSERFKYLSKSVMVRKPASRVSILNFGDHDGRGENHPLAEFCIQI